MPIFVSSTTAARRHGVYAIRRTPPATIRAAGTGVVAIIAQFPWGPDQVLTTPAGTKELLDMVAPSGMTRTGSGYLSLLGKAYPTLRFVRVVGSGAAKASATLTQTGPVDVLTVEAKYKGSGGNSLSAVVDNATDGDVNHFNLTVSCTGASGTTTDVFENLNYSGTGDDSVPTFSSKLLVGAITRLAAGRPTNGTYTFSGGSDGTVTGSDYVGTAGAPDAGISLLEADNSIAHFFTDDPGDTLRAAVNAGIKAHAELMGDRIGYVCGDADLTSAEVVTDAANYRSEFVVYADPWVYVYDDVTGAEQLVPPTGFAASVAAQVSPSTSIAWKDPEVGEMLTGIVRLAQPRGQAAADLTDAGVCCLIEEENGGHRFEAGVVTIAPSDPSRRTLARTRMGVYIAKSFVQSVRSFVDAPNVPANWDLILGALDAFMSGLKKAQHNDPNHTPHVRDYAILDLSAVNSQSDLDNGIFTIPLNVKTSSAMEKIFLSIQYGESVTVKAS